MKNTGAWQSLSRSSEMCMPQATTGYGCVSLDFTFIST